MNESLEVWKSVILPFKLLLFFLSLNFHFLISSWSFLKRFKKKSSPLSLIYILRGCLYLHCISVLKRLGLVIWRKQSVCNPNIIIIIIIITIIITTCARKSTLIFKSTSDSCVRVCESHVLLAQVLYENEWVEEGGSWHILVDRRCPFILRIKEGRKVNRGFLYLTINYDVDWKLPVNWILICLWFYDHIIISSHLSFFFCLFHSFYSATNAITFVVCRSISNFYVRKFYFLSFLFF